MASVTEMKDERRDHKKKVTIAARRLNGSIDRNQPDEMIHTFASKLEEDYSDFLIVHEDYEELVNSNPDYSDHGTVNGLSCQQYLEAVTDVYDTAMTKYETFNDGVKEKNSRPIFVEIEYLKL